MATKLSFLVIVSLCGNAVAQADSLLYRDATQPVESRVQDLLHRMTLAEKVGQINMPCVYVGGLGRDVAGKTEGCKKFTLGQLEPGVGPAGGFFTMANTILLEGPGQQVAFFNELQQMAIQQTRLGVPLLQTEEGTHGLMCSLGTIFPEGPGLGSMWNLDLVRQIYAAAAREARSVGIHQLCTLVVEPIRDPRLGRNQEAYGEDPFFCGCMARTIVEAVQGDDIRSPEHVVAVLCHYPGQSQPVSGFERGAMEISERTLREVFLVPWVAGIKIAGALGVMATYPTIDGTPVHASEWILTKILREELGFQGLVLSEGSGIETIIYEHLARDYKDAGVIALKAGVDVGISYESAYMRDMIESVEQGLVPESLLDRTVARILRMKFRLGLFESPYVDATRAKQVVHNAKHQDVALQAARESIVLLRNEGNVLPLSKDVESIAVIGPNADHAKNQLGDYVSRAILQDIMTVLDGIRKTVSPRTKVEYVKGCDVVGTGNNEIDEAREAARRAKVAIVVVGENEWGSPNKTGTDGEGYDAATLELTGLQLDLVKAVHETGTPTVVVLINGRPLAIRWVAENVPAVVEAWLPGEKGGQAVAEVLFGDHNPSGRLTVTVPRHAGQLPVYYNCKPSKAHWVEHGWGKPYVDMNPTPLYEFGHGLSYTKFQYSNLKIEPRNPGIGGSVHVSVDIENTGDRPGSEVVQLYIDDPISSVVTPVKQLRGFEKVLLAPGESKTVRFVLTPEHLALLNRYLEWVVEPGEFRVMVGRSSKDIRLTGTFEVAGR
ncbi:MAG: glycoside hydrolase family 3 C-terminal domain-containing protein [Sedimentisphaerales bacterium]|nr:glycoside hydrolase family 3 C-terminal domain-containing protein [Sedimentisphaerales bacterium]